MIMLDNTVVNVALPSIQKDLGMSPSELEWVFNAYALKGRGRARTSHSATVRRQSSSTWQPDCSTRC
jgi:hypothetical protein